MPPDRPIITLLYGLFARVPWTRRVFKPLVVLASFGLATFLALHFGAGGPWRGFDPALAIAKPGAKVPYDLTRLEAVNQTLRYIRNRYVDPERVKPRDMLLSALNYVQGEVAQLIVLPEWTGISWPTSPSARWWCVRCAVFPACRWISI